MSMMFHLQGSGCYGCPCFTIRQRYLAELVKEYSQKIPWLLLHVRVSNKDKSLQQHLLLRETEAQTVLTITMQVHVRAKLGALFPEVPVQRFTQCHSALRQNADKSLPCACAMCTCVQLSPSTHIHSQISILCSSSKFFRHEAHACAILRGNLKKSDSLDLAALFTNYR